jgi:hypothetical protein
MQVHEKFNLTPFSFEFGPCLDKDGREFVVATLKATFLFSDNGKISTPDKELMLPVFFSDQFYDQPDNSSLKYPSDVVYGKPGTDVILVGHGYNLDNKGNKGATTAFLSIGGLQKTICLFGSRRWEKTRNSNRISPPEPFDKVPLNYEYAYGGSYADEKHGKCSYDLNPVGIGFGVITQDGLPLPRLEYPDQMIKSPGDRPSPASFGAVAMGWKQRYRFAGTFDENWYKARRPLLPVDFDEQFYHAAPNDQTLKSKLNGGEQLTMQNLHPRKAKIQAEIPKLSIKTIFRIKDRSEELPMAIDTLLVEPDANRMALTFVSACPIDNDFQYIKSIMVRPQA